MLIRQLKADSYDYFQKQLIKKAHQEPLNAFFDVSMEVDRNEYIVRIQPESKHRLIVLQALEVKREIESGQLHTLITDNKILSSLLELLILQGIA